MQALLLRDWKNEDVTGWVASPKLDGWRLIWNGQNFLTRQGKILDAPEWFKAGMPSAKLDGELFCDRGGFNEIRLRMKNGWQGLKFHIFDAPCDDLVFSERFELVESLSLPSHCEVIQHVELTSTKEFQDLACAECRLGGEGYVARNPDAFWKAGRSSDVLRFVPVDPALNRRAVNRLASH